MIAAIALAVSISSPEIGTFFDLNDMVPASVPAERTFGSDDATNATHRLDPTEQAAVYAMFDAYCERCYFPNVGLSNVWNEAKYGPECRGSSGLDKFQFAPTSGYTRTAFWYDPDTNRTVRTRRLVEYSNIRRLCEALRLEPATMLDLYRPSWYRSNASIFWSSTLLDDLDLEHGQVEEFPEIGWMTKEEFLRSEDMYFWGNVALYFSNLKYERRDPVNWTDSDTALDRCLIRPVLDDIGLGDPPTSSYLYTLGYLPPSYRLTNTTFDVVGRGTAVTNVDEGTYLVTNVVVAGEGFATNIVEKNYAVTNISWHVGLEGVTNTTHRLISKNCAAIGLALSALDRTYMQLETGVGIPGMTNFYAAADRNYKTEKYTVTTGPLEFLVSSWRCRLAETSIPEPSLEEESSSLESAGGSAGGGEYQIYCNPAKLTYTMRTAIDPDSSVAHSTIVSWDQRTLEYYLRSIVSQKLIYGPRRIEFTFADNARFEPPSGEIFLTLQYFSYEQPYVGGSASIGVGFPPQRGMTTELDLVTHFSTQVAYRFGHTDPLQGELRRMDGHYPFPADYSRVSSANAPQLWTLFSRGCAWGDAEDEYASDGLPVRYYYVSEARSSFEYSSLADSYSSLSEAYGVFDDHYSHLAEDCKSKFESAAGLRVEDLEEPLDMLDRVEAGMTEAETLSNLRLEQSSSVQLEVACIAAGGSDLPPVHIEGNVDEHGLFTFTRIYRRTSTGGEEPVSFPFGVYSLGYVLDDRTSIKPGHEPEDENFYGAGVSGRMSSLAKVDWDWKALKRERTNK